MTQKKTVLNALIDSKKNTLIFFITLPLLAVIAPFKSFIMQWLIDSDNIINALKSLAIGIGVVLGSHYLELVCSNSFTKMASNGCLILRRELIENTINSLCGNRRKENSNISISTLTNDIKMISDDYYYPVFDFLFWGSMGVVSLLMLFHISFAMGVTTIILMIFPILVPQVMKNKLSSKRALLLNSLTSYTNKVDGILGGVKVLISSDSLNYLRINNNDAANDCFESEKDLQCTINLASVLTSLFAWIPNIMTMAIGVILVFKGEITIGYLVTAQSLTNFVLSPARMVANAYVKIKSSDTVIHKINSMINSELIDSACIGEDSLKLSTIKFSSVSYKYPGNHVNALSDLNFEIHNGEKVAIVGKSGCGKSTLLKALNREVDINKGSIEINNKNIGSLPQKSYYRMVSMVPQNPYIFNDSIRNNICLYNKFTENDFSNAIQNAGLLEYINGCLEGADTKLSSVDDGLSGGQAQRIAIARSLIRKCDLLLLDEPTASLDVINSSKILNNILLLPCTVIVSTHDVYNEYLKKFDRILYMSDGVISESGTYDELLKKQNDFYKMIQNGDVNES